MIRAFVDANVLIAAFRGKSTIREGALSLLESPNLEFWYSPLLRLEVTLQPTRNKQTAELAFYAEYFKDANCYGELNRMLEIAEPEAKINGITVVDALHIAAANLAKCHAFFTTERLDSPMFRTKLVKMIQVSDARGTSTALQKLR